jgi:hypothetical protein
MEMKVFENSGSPPAYKKVVFRQRIDYCEMATSRNNMPILISLFVPQLLDIVVLPLCPVVGRHEMNFTIPLLSADPMIVGRGEYLLDIDFISESGVNMWELLTYLKVGED